ncbi:MAG: EamA family transporter RarD [Acidimicrobiia bacterium]
MSEARRGALAGVLAYGLWGLFPLYFHHTAPATPVEVLFHRMVWTLLVVAIWLSARHEWAWWKVARRDGALVRRVTLGAFMLSVNWGIYIWAVNNDHVVDAALGYFINPLVTVALGVVVLKEQLRPLQLAAVSLGAVSVAVLTVGYGRPPWIALVLAGSFATYGFMKKTVNLPAVQSLCLETIVMLPVAAVGFVVLLSRGDVTIGSEGPGHAALLAMSGVVTAVPLVLFGVAARRIPLTMLGLLQYLTPVLQLLCGVIAFHESVPLVRWIGFVVVWAALGMLLLDVLRSQAEARPARSVSLDPAPVAVAD